MKVQAQEMKEVVNVREYNTKGEWHREVRRKNYSYVRETDRKEETINLRGIEELGRNKRKNENK